MGRAWQNGRRWPSACTASWPLLGAHGCLGLHLLTDFSGVVMIPACHMFSHEGCTIDRISTQNFFLFKNLELEYFYCIAKIFHNENVLPQKSKHIFLKEEQEAILQTQCPELTWLPHHHHLGRRLSPRACRATLAATKPTGGREERVSVGVCSLCSHSPWGKGRREEDPPALGSPGGSRAVRSLREGLWSSMVCV